MSHLTNAQRLRAARNAAGITQSELAKLTGINQPNIARYERGSGATTETMDRLFGYLREHYAASAEVLDSLDGVLGIQGRTQGKLGVVLDPMAAPKPKDWIVQDFLARRNVTILAGQEGGGKSMATQTIAAACITGATETMGFHMPAGGRNADTNAERRPLRVLIVDVENVLMVDEDIDPSIVTERLQKYGMTEENKHYVTITGAQGFDLDMDSDGIDGILADAAANDRAFDVVILDSFRSLWTSGSENTPAAGKVLLKYMRIAHKHDAAILLLHHQNKAGAAYSGHSSIGSTVSAVWTFSKMLEASGVKGVAATPHPTMRYLSPYKVRIAPMAQGRMVATSDRGIVAPMTADEYAGLVVDPGTEEEDAASE